MRSRFVQTLVMALLIGSISLPAHAQTGSFVDDDGNPHEANIEGIAAAGVTRGCNPPMDDRYCPSGLVSRAEMAVFLIRALGEDGQGEYTGRFPDVPDGLWFTDAIERAAEIGLTTGYTDGLFRPNDTVSRGEMAAFLLRARGNEPAAQSLSTFSANCRIFSGGRGQTSPSLRKDAFGNASFAYS